MAHVGPMLMVHIHFVGPTSAIHIGPTQLCSWDQCGTNIKAPYLANFWSNVDSTLYPRLQNKIYIIYLSNYLFIFILIITFYVSSSKKIACVPVVQLPPHITCSFFFFVAFLGLNQFCRVGLRFVC